MPKNMTLRLDDVLATELDMVAAVDGHPVAEAVRIAIVDHIEQRRTSEDFQRKLAANIERMRKLMVTDNGDVIDTPDNDEPPGERYPNDQSFVDTNHDPRLLGEA